MGCVLRVLQDSVQVHRCLCARCHCTARERACGEVHAEADEERDVCRITPKQSYRVVCTIKMYITLRTR